MSLIYHPLFHGYWLLYIVVTIIISSSKITFGLAGGLKTLTPQGLLNNYIQVMMTITSDKR